MKRVFSWIRANKITLSGILALILYILDQAFKITEIFALAKEIYYGISIILFVVIGYAISGRGFESIEEFTKIAEKHKQLKETKTIEDKIEIISDIIDNKEDK